MLAVALLHVPRDNGACASGWSARLSGWALPSRSAAVMLPFRSQLATATAAVVLVVPCVAGVVTGGLVAGLVTVAAGFLIYDFVFVPPYGTLNVSGWQDWVALGVYVVVTLLVAGDRHQSRHRPAPPLALGRPTPATCSICPNCSSSISPRLSSVKPWSNGRTTSSGLEGVALLLSVDGRLDVVASSGTPISPEELSRLQPDAGLPVALSTGTSHDVVQTLALASSGRPVGLLVMRDVPAEPTVRELLPIVGNHLAVALERAQLRERIVHAEVLEEVDRLRHSLIGAVSHDLRTPLATIKVASSTFLDRSSELSPGDAAELHSLIDLQADRLTRLVNSLLDMTRIQSGTLEVRRRPWSLRDIVNEALAELHSSLAGRPVDVVLPDGLPFVDVDPLLISQVLANLVDNANRHGPAGTPINGGGVRSGATTGSRSRSATVGRGARS